MKLFRERTQIILSTFQEGMLFCKSGKVRGLRTFQIERTAGSGEDRNLRKWNE